MILLDIIVVSIHLFVLEIKKLYGLFYIPTEHDKNIHTASYTIQMPISEFRLLILSSPICNHFSKDHLHSISKRIHHQIYEVKHISTK